VLEPGRHWDGYVRIDAVERSLLDSYGTDSNWRVRPFVHDAAGKT
jgi:hypothetical protein